jgi:chloride channel 7
MNDIFYEVFVIHVSFSRMVGAIYGRIVGRMMVTMFGVHQMGYWEWMDPGAFALIGAASFFGGVTRLTLATTVIMVHR